MAQLTTGCTGIVKSLKPVIKDGEHETWTNDKDVTFYKFWIEIDDIKAKKPVLSKDKQPWYKDGTAVQYTLETLADGKFNISEIKKPESKDAKDAHIKEAYKDKPLKKDEPVVIHQMAMSKAIGLAITFFKEMNNINEYEKFIPPSPATVFQVADLFYEWMTKDVKDSNLAWTRRDMLLESILSMKWFNKWYPDPENPEEKIRLTDKVIRLAESYLTAPLAITKDVLDANLGGEKK